MNKKLGLFLIIGLAVLLNIGLFSFQELVKNPSTTKEVTLSENKADFSENIIVEEINKDSEDDFESNAPEEDTSLPFNEPEPLTKDFNSDGYINGADLANLLSNWGECPIYNSEEVTAIIDSENQLRIHNFGDYTYNVALEFIDGDQFDGEVSLEVNEISTSILFEDDKWHNGNGAFIEIIDIGENGLDSHVEYKLTAVTERCATDFNFNGVTDSEDITELEEEWTNIEIEETENTEILNSNEIIEEGFEFNADLNGDDSVDGTDLANLLANWGECPNCTADLDGNGFVNAIDKALILGAWNPVTKDIRINEIDVSPESPNEGEAIHILVELENIGNVVAENIKLKYTLTYVDNPSETFIECCVNLQASEVKQFITSWNPGYFGPTTLKIEAIYPEDSNQENNVQEYEFIIFP